MTPETRCARTTDGTHVAYQVHGDVNAGTHELKGIPEPWRVYRVTTVDPD